MNKKKFLKILEEKLQILSEEERNDILNEYKDTIEEKVRHGSSEEEAVADFGSIEELSREILKAYKINPDYKKTDSKEKVKDIVEQSESLIKRGAHKLSNWTKDAVEDFKNSDFEWSLEMVFEILIKAIILLVGLALLRLPFYMIEYLGISIFEMTFPPISSILRVIWRCIIGIVYFLVCIVIALIVFKPYFVSKTKSSKKKIKDKEIKQTESENLEMESQTVSRKNGVGRGIIEFLKGILFLFLVFPLYFIDFGCYIAVGVIIFLLIEGVPAIGLLLLSLGVSIFFIFLTRFCYHILYGKKRVYCYSLILSAILFVSGFFFTLSTVTRFVSYRGLPNDEFKMKQVIYEEDITDYSFQIPYWNYSIEEDDSLEDNKIEVAVTYYSDFVEDVRKDTTIKNETLYMYFKKDFIHLNYSTKKQLYQMIVKELKDYRWYDYQDLIDLKIVVRVNQNTIDKIR